MRKVLSCLEEVKQTATTTDRLTKTHLDLKLKHPIYEVGCHLVCSAFSGFRTLA